MKDEVSQFPLVKTLKPPVRRNIMQAERVNHDAYAAVFVSQTRIIF